MLVVYKERIDTHVENTTLTHLVLRHLNYSQMNHSLLMTGTFPVQITNHNQSILIIIIINPSATIVMSISFLVMYSSSKCHIPLPPPIEGLKIPGGWG